MIKFKVLKDIAIADVAFEAEGKDLNELFESAAIATEEIMVNTKTLKKTAKREINIENEKLEDLLYDFLSELIFIKDTERIAFASVKIDISEKNKKYMLKAVLKGEELNQQKHECRADVKAITMHMFKIEQKKDKWTCLVVVDI